MQEKVSVIRERIVYPLVLRLLGLVMPPTILNWRVTAGSEDGMVTITCSLFEETVAHNMGLIKYVVVSNMRTGGTYYIGGAKLTCTCSTSTWTEGDSCMVTPDNEKCSYATVNVWGTVEAIGDSFTGTWIEVTWTGRCFE